MIDAPEKRSIIRMFHVHQNYGPKKALIDITLDIAKNEFVFISGPSGAGKTTLLKLLYLGEPVSEGQILIDGINLARIPRKRIPFLRRKFGVIFQDYKLIPTKSVYDNVALVLEAAGAKKRLIQNGHLLQAHECPFHGMQVMQYQPMVQKTKVSTTLQKASGHLRKVSLSRGSSGACAKTVHHVLH